MSKAAELKARIAATRPPFPRIPGPPPAVPDHEMLRCIGQGSYGEVWLARNAVGTWRAVKVVYRDHFKDARPYEREFLGIQKYEPLSRTNDGLVDVLQIGRNDGEGYFYYVMELADGAGGDPKSECRNPNEVRNPKSEAETSQQDVTNFECGQLEDAITPSLHHSTTPSLHHPTSPSLRDPGAYVPKTLAWELQNGGRLTVEECITLGLTLNLALGHLHQHGLIHRDVKPSNIIFVNGVPKLADIGLVVELSEAQSFVGTEGFIPPEGPNSPQADLYALGKVLYEASMGKDRQEFPEPFTGLGLDAQSKTLMELNAVLLRACAPTPNLRYKTAEEMNADLALLHSGQSVRDKHALQRRVKLTTRLSVAVAAVMVLGVVPYYLAIKEAHLARSAAQQAEAARNKAQTEAAKSEQVAGFLREVLKSLGPSAAWGGDRTLLHQMLSQRPPAWAKGLPISLR